MHGDHFDVVIVGAGLSGVGAACHLRARHPQRSLAILEARAAIGGTWDLFRYPGVRSDSDMFTLGYSFRPWEQAEAIADGSAILRYIRDTAREHGVEESIRLGHRVVRAEWSSDDARWRVEAAVAGRRESVTLTCDFLYVCSGYYRYDEGYAPEFEGTERFRGPIVHPQHWPDDLDWDGKRVVVVGSGATAVTLVPALAERAAHVTMLQRSPGYVVSLPARDPVAALLRRALPARAVYPIVRWKNVLTTQLSYVLSRRFPRQVRAAIRRLNKHLLPPGFDVDTHFRPRYDPWDERLCLVPDADLFRALGDGRASIVTDRIETFTERGIALASGGEIEADVIITATGLNLLPLGGIDLAVDGREVDLPQSVGYKGMMLCGVPNLALALGYTNASWTLKCDLVAQYVCRLLAHMDAHGQRVATALPPDTSVALEPFLDLKSGYVMRSLHLLPKQGATAPWRLHQNYPRDVVALKRGPVDDAMAFSPGPLTAARSGSAARPAA